MNIIGVASLRNILHENYRDIVYEWEDIIVKSIKGELFCVGNRSFKTDIHRKLDNFFQYVCKKYILETFSYHNIQREGSYLAFCMNPAEISLYRDVNVIPVFIDVWPRDFRMIKRLVKGQFAVVTSLDVYRNLKSELPNLIYMPLSISDVWKNNVKHKNPIMVQMGRKNMVLHNYAKKYADDTGVEYIFSEYNSTTRELTYYSTNKGKINTPQTRVDYMGFLNEALIALVSSPGMDQSRPMAKGIDYPTPRFYEVAINYCHMVGRYDESHIEFKQQGIDMVCSNIKSYEQFQKEVNDILAGRKINKQKYDEFIDMHLTSTWIKCLLKKLNA